MTYGKAKLPKIILWLVSILAIIYLFSYLSAAGMLFKIFYYELAIVISAVLLYLVGLGL